MRRWRVTPPPALPGDFACLSPAEIQAAAPQVTPGMVAQAFQRVPLPGLRSVSQPGTKTLLNFDTIFHTTATPLTRDLNLLGQRIRLQITPSRFTWHWGDGTSTTTTTPGAPYPSKQIVHRYPHAHTTVEHHLVTTWTARWSLNGGPLQPVPGTVTTTGAATALRIAEASPTLSGNNH